MPNVFRSIVNQTRTAEPKSALLALFFEVGLNDGRVSRGGAQGFAVIEHRQAGDVNRYLADFGLVRNHDRDGAVIGAVAKTDDAATPQPRSGQGDGLGGHGHYWPSAVRGSNNRFTRPSNQSSDWVPVNL